MPQLLQGLPKGPGIQVAMVPGMEAKLGLGNMDLSFQADASAWAEVLNTGRDQHMAPGGTRPR